MLCGTLFASFCALPLRLNRVLRSNDAGVLAAEDDLPVVGSVDVRLDSDGRRTAALLFGRCAAFNAPCFGSPLLGRLICFGLLLAYAELGVDVKVGNGDLSRGERGSERSDWLLDIRRKSCCVLWLRLRGFWAGEADGRGIRACVCADSSSAVAMP